MTGRIGRRSPRVRRRFTEQGGFFQFILSGAADVQLVKCQKSMEAGAGNRGVYPLGLQIGSPEITAWRVSGVPHDGTPTKSERQGNNQTPHPNSDTVLRRPTHKRTRVQPDRVGERPYILAPSRR